MGLEEIRALTAARTGAKAKPAKVEKNSGKQQKNSKKAENSGNSGKKFPKRIKPRSKKMAKKMRKLGKINQELLGDRTGDPTELCEIQSPVCTRIATVLNHNQGRDGDNLLDKSKLSKCCPPCNDYIEKHHAWAKERGFKDQRHGKK